ncbi:TolC family protein [Lentisphaera profundi]|uniref:TolC family protein n=1 Tax=Lentisphaera profundi TaxID=1658616 RepID=A0ABY7VPS4_9BACT|nr:TolC family protein [Lentisphaera profundi]WDE96171.1 TolC family protein [Lentisphaera profundi]
MKNLLFILLFTCTLHAQQKTWSIDTIIEYAVKNSQTIKNSELSLENRVQNSAIARSAYDLGISSTASSKTDGSSDSQSFRLNQPLPAGFEANVTGAHSQNGNSDTDNTDLALSISKQILGGGSLSSSLKSIRNAHTDELIGLNSLKRSKRDLVRDVMNSFYRLIRISKSLDISLRRLETSKKNLEMAIAREDPLDISSAKINVPRDEISVIAARVNLKNELDNLQVLMGLAPKEEFKVETNFEFSLAKPNSAEDMIYAQQNSEDFLNLELSRIKLDRELEDRDEKNSVDVSLFVRHNLENDTNENINLRGDEETTVGVNLNWTLGNRAEIAQLKIAKNNLRENGFDYKILYNQRLQSLRRLERALNELNKSIQVQIQEIKFNEEQLELYKDRWESGKMAILEYLRSQNRLEDSRIQLINLKTNYMETLQNYLFDTGMSYAPNLTIVKKDKLTNLDEISVYK